MEDDPCSCPNRAIVVFDHKAWASLFSDLASNVFENAARLYFEEATFYLPDTPSSPVRDLKKKRFLLGLLPAHIATLSFNAIQGGNGLVSVVTYNSAICASQPLWIKQQANPICQTQFRESYMGGNISGLFLQTGFSYDQF